MNHSEDLEILQDYRIMSFLEFLNIFLKAVFASQNVCYAVFGRSKFQYAVFGCEKMLLGMQSFALNFSSMHSLDFKKGEKEVCSLQGSPLMYPLQHKEDHIGSKHKGLSGRNVLKNSRKNRTRTDSMECCNNHNIIYQPQSAVAML